MANNTLKTRIVLNNHTSAEWASDTYKTKVPLKGEICIYSDLRKIKIGDGSTTITDLSFAYLTPEEIQSIMEASSHTHDNKPILDGTTASFTTELLNKLNNIADSATKVIIDSELKSDSTNPVQNKVIKSALDGKVPTTRTVNNKPLSENITLTASDVGADPSGSASSALESAKTYANEKLNEANKYTDKKVSDLVGSAPETLNTLEELAQAIEDHQDVTDLLTDAIGKKVDKVDGKGLSTNDLTDTLKQNYDSAYNHSQSAHAPSNAEKNVIVGVQKNGTDLTPDSNRKVNISVPTKTSDITNDSDFVSSTGTISKANQLATARTIGISGAVNGTATSFDGTKNIVIEATSVNAAKLTLSASDTLILDGNF